MVIIDLPLPQHFQVLVSHPEFSPKTSDYSQPILRGLIRIPYFYRSSIMFDAFSMELFNTSFRSPVMSAMPYQMDCFCLL